VYVGGSSEQMEEADERDEFSTIASGAGNSLVVGYAG
jgi:hypothetical protein